MAPMKNILAALALATFATAAPVAQQNTVTETVWTTVDVTTTVYVDEPSPAAQVENAPPAAPAAVTTTTSSPPVVATTSASTTYSPAPVAAAAAAPVAPAPAADSPAAFAASADPSPSTVTPEAATPVAASSPSSSAAAPVPKTAGASSGGPCTGESNACTGDVTHYDGGLGACGWNVNTASDMQIALPHGMMGTQSNGNPYCGKSLTIKTSSGGTVQATVGDKCMGCEGNSIDLTDALFAAVVPNGDGRVSGIEWWFN